MGNQPIYAKATSSFSYGRIHIYLPIGSHIIGKACKFRIELGKYLIDECNTLFECILSVYIPIRNMALVVFEFWQSQQPRFKLVITLRYIESSRDRFNQRINNRSFNVVG